MTIQTPPDPTADDSAMHLPEAVMRFLREADPQHKANAHDLLAAFATDATVVDNEHSYTGHDEIHRWREAEMSKYTYTVMATHVEKFDDTRYVVTNRLEGDFPGGVVDIIYRFTLAGDLITRLEIAP
ncbi:nuclear transport factor 2 family protein [Kribbella sp. NPDC048928]|uniref:nuclear transport factor 2 family protein n=1 Tax=Kribbella sp. NPDC048928 TaxID=3364111 RepID=UPI00371680D3